MTRRKSKPQEQPVASPGLRLEWRSPAELAENPRNWRRHPESQLKALAGAVSEVGWAGACLYNEATGRLIDGHARRKVAQEQGCELLPVLVGSWTEEQEAKILATLDPLAGMAEADPVMLDQLLRGVETGCPELADMIEKVWEDAQAGAIAEVEPADPVDAEPQTDRAAELREKWGTAAGQLWLLGKHRLLCGDSTKPEDVARVMGGEACSLVVTDPPYGVEYADKNRFLNAICRGNRIQEPIVNDHGNKEDIQAVWKAAFHEMAEAMKPGAVVYCFMPQGGDQMMMMMMMMGAGIEPRHELIWVKNNHVLGRVDYAYKHEPILYAWKEGGHKFYGDFQTSILEFPKPQKSDLHPTMKPVELIQRLIENSSQRDEIVYDPFLGSGTTMIAAENLNRRAVGIEISPAYCAVILQRYADAFPDQEIRQA